MRRGDVLRAWLAWRYDKRMATRARTTLRSLEAEDGAPLPRRIRREADAYAREVLGSRRYAPWLYVYAKVQGRMREGWIPDGFMGRVVAPRVNHVYARVSDRKTFTRAVFPGDALPDVAYLIAGRYHDAAYRPLEAHEVASAVFSCGSEVVVKSDDSGRGAGVEVVAHDSFDASALARRRPDAVVQRRLRHHPSFDRFGGGEGATIRVTTCRTPDGRIEARATHVQLPVAGERFSRAGFRANVAFDRSTGRLFPRGLVGGWTRRDRLRDGAVPFEGAVFPGYERCVKMCTGLHATRPHLGVIGWDALIDPDERTWVLEWNARHPAINLAEAWAGPCFRGLGWERLRPVRGAFPV